MDHRLYFVLGDLATSLLSGALVGWVSWLLIGLNWNMFFAMVVMMIIGMLLATILWLPCSILFGAMEIMVPMMLTGMMSGMVVGMWAAMAPLSAISALGIGTVCGLASIVAVWIANNALRGTQSSTFQ